MRRNSEKSAKSDARYSKSRVALKCSRWDCDVQLFRRVPVSFPSFALWHPPRRFFLEYCADACPGEAFDDSQARLVSLSLSRSLSLSLDEVMPHMLPSANYFCDRCDERIAKNHGQTDREFFEETVATHVREHYEAYDPMEIRHVLCNDDDGEDMACRRCMEPLRMGYDATVQRWVYEECVEVDSGSDSGADSKSIVHRNCPNEKHYNDSVRARGR